MSAFEQVRNDLLSKPRNWLVTGVAGFIGSNILEALLRLNQNVLGVDNFSTGSRENLADVEASVSKEQWRRFAFREADVTDPGVCTHSCEGMDHVLHQAALGSVPRSLDDPIATNRANVDGFLNMLVAAKESSVGSLVYAASSSVYGDAPGLPQIEGNIGKPLSPYALTKYVNELYAGVFSRSYGFHATGLRYFSVFGKRQNPDGPYAAVIPKWTAAMINGDDVIINGDGSTSRDFCYVENVVQANLLASLNKEQADSQVFNIAFGSSTDLNELFGSLRHTLQKHGLDYPKSPEQGPFRAGDIKHSQADIKKANSLLSYSPQYSLSDGLDIYIPWCLSRGDQASL